jgi:hypothetical protein
MGLSGAIGDAWEILANVGYPGSFCAADPGWARDERGSVLVVLLLRTSGLGTGGFRDERCSVLGCCCCVTCGDHRCFGEVTAVLMTSCIVYERRGRFG